MMSTTGSRQNARPSLSRRRPARWCAAFGSRVLLERRRRDTVRVRGGGDASAAPSNGGSANSNGSSSSPSSLRYHHNLRSSHPRSYSHTTALQFTALCEFISFMQKLLKTTEVSQSVIVLSLHCIYRLKERNEFSVGKPGSEFRVAVVALMMANESVDE